MTFGDLLDQVAFESGDKGGDYRDAARRWLNLTRSELSDHCLWRSALRATATLTTSAANTTGIYSIGSTYDRISGDELYDETNSATICHDSTATSQAVDPAKAVSGIPTIWADAGMDSNGERNIYLWPVPSGTYTIRFVAYLKVMDIAETDEGLSVDPFFGPVAPWAACFAAGIRFYHDQNNNEDVSATSVSRRMFERQISLRRKNNELAPVSALGLDIVRTNGSRVILGRFPPAHFSNR